MILLDTHVLLRAVAGRSPRDEVRVLNDDFWAISDIVLWEIGHLEREREIQPVLMSAEFSRLMRPMTVFPVDVRVALALRQLDFRADPADEVIAATSIVHEVPLLTRDARILGSKVVPLALRDQALR